MENANLSPRTLVTPKGNLELHPATFESLSYLNPSISLKNLIQFKDVAAVYDLEYYLLYGTLLGAYRENDFISHDVDSDLFIHLENFDKLLCVIFDLVKLHHFNLIRVDGDMFSISRNGEYIDIYVFRLSGKLLKCNDMIIPSQLIRGRRLVKLRGEEFFAPEDTEKLLVHLYGGDWRIPKKGANARPYSLYNKAKKLIYRFIPNSIKRFINILKS